MLESTQARTCATLCETRFSRKKTNPDIQAFSDCSLLFAKLVYKRSNPEKTSSLSNFEAKASNQKTVRVSGISMTSDVSKFYACI